VRAGVAGYEFTALVIFSAEFNDLLLQLLIKARPGSGFESPIFFLGFFPFDLFLPFFVVGDSIAKPL